MKNVSYDYEEPHENPDPRNFWHIYSTDQTEVLEGGTLMYLYGPMTEEMEAKIIAICEAIDAAVETVPSDWRAEK